MHEFAPKAVAGLVILYVVWVAILELVKWDDVRTLGNEFFGERTWRLLESQFLWCGLGFLSTSIWLLLDYDQWSPVYKLGLTLLILTEVCFAFAIHRSGFFDETAYRPWKKSFTLLALTILLASLFFGLPHKKTRIAEVLSTSPQPISQTQQVTSPKIVIPSAVKQREKPCEEDNLTVCKPRELAARADVLVEELRTAYKTYLERFNEENAQYHEVADDPSKSLLEKKKAQESGIKIVEFWEGVLLKEYSSKYRDDALKYRDAMLAKARREPEMILNLKNTNHLLLQWKFQT